MTSTPRYKIYRHIICDLCLEHGVPVVQYHAGFDAICNSCLKMEEKERADQVNFANMKLRNKVLPLSPLSSTISFSAKMLPLLPEINIDFDAASRAWRANKKKVKNGDGSFVYI
jgi:hypothetical protein